MDLKHIAHGRWSFIFILPLLLLAANLHAAPKQDVSLLWTADQLWQFGGGHFRGNDKSWKSIGGSSFAMRYSGKGPLPNPIEFVIPLKQALPLGTYRLFVKNFALGTMEATVGDITHPLHIRRYDWTPGQIFETNAPVDRIVLRYFPSHMVKDTGAEQKQQYIVQGVYLTTDASRVPVRDGQLVSTVDEKPPEKPIGNCLENASFETGIYPWGKPYGMSGVIDASHLDSTTAADGATSLKLAAGPDGRPGLESRFYRLPTGRYTFSFAARADQPVTLIAAVMGMREDLKGESPAGIQKAVTLNDKWQRFVVSGDLHAAPGSLHCVRFWSKKGDAPRANVWFDAIQLCAGNQGEFLQSPSIGCISQAVGNIFYANTPSTIDVVISGSDSRKVSYQTCNYWNNVVASGQLDAKPRQTFSIPTTRSGLFRTTFSLGQRQCEFVYSVLPANEHLNESYAASSMGADASFSPQQLQILKRANFNWVMSKFAGRWSLVEKEEGQFKFSDAEIAAARDAKMCVMLQLMSVKHEEPEWLKPFCKPAGGATWEPAKKQEFMRRWGDFVYRMVDHFKGDVHDWEIDNEPNARYSGEEYGDLLKAASQAIRRADPQAHIIAFAGGGFKEDFYQEAISRAGADTFDAFSVHFYGNNLAPMQAFAEMLNSYHKPGWNTETGATCPTFFELLPGYDDSHQSPADLEQTHLEALHTVTVHIAENYLLSMSAARMERRFQYFSRGGNAAPSQPTARFGNGEEITEYDGSLRGSGVALSIASHFLNGATYHSQIPNDRLLVQLFTKGNTCVGFCCPVARQSVKITPPADLLFYDIMGNRIDKPEIEIPDEPVYFTFTGSPEDASKMFGSMKIAGN